VTLKWNAMEQPNPETRETYSGTKRTNKMKSKLKKIYTQQSLIGRKKVKMYITNEKKGNRKTIRTGEEMVKRWIGKQNV
jgi:hypothetical protein